MLTARRRQPYKVQISPCCHTRSRKGSKSPVGCGERVDDPGKQSSRRKDEEYRRDSHVVLGYCRKFITILKTQGERRQKVEKGLDDVS